MEANYLPEEAYEQNIKNYTELLSKHKKKRSNIGWIRLFSAIAFCIAAYYGFVYAGLAGWIVVLAGIGAFLFLVLLDGKNDEKIFYYEKLLQINNEELEILEWRYFHRETGLIFLPDEHPYAADIDLFGTSSIYQYINRCTAEQSKALLAASLLAPSLTELIIQRQEASIELATKLNWRQQLQFEGILNPVTLTTEERMIEWVESKTPYQESYWRAIALIFPIITLGFTAAFIVNLIPGSLFSLLVFIFYLISIFVSRKIGATYSALSKIEKEVSTIYNQLKHFEDLTCSSSLLCSLQKHIEVNGKAHESIRQLKKVLSHFDYRLNATAFLILNTFFLWDLRQVLSLNKWKAKYASGIKNWFYVIANVELLSTLATLTYNHPDWVFPTIAEEHFTLKAEQMGHPLIQKEKRVDSSFTTQGPGKISIITGSNMAGKSTFLRSIGVNLVLAQIGAPVCANSFVSSPVHLYTSMRISDNLAENTSTFYAELKKLKTIIDKVNAHQKIFILLDEILRGTNSLDRHTGSVALVRQFIRREAVAVIATHDVQLATLKEEFAEHIENYHFDAQVAGEELYFDYKLKRGICQSMNASLLMKKIGIELNAI